MKIGEAAAALGRSSMQGVGWVDGEGLGQAPPQNCTRTVAPPRLRPVEGGGADEHYGKRLS